MIDNIYAQNLQKGDLIVVAYGNSNVIGIYIGEGKRGNTNYYNLYAWQNDKYKDTIRKKLNSGKSYRKDYIIRTYNNVIAKVHFEDIKPEIRSWYNEFKSLLQKNGKL